MSRGEGKLAYLDFYLKLRLHYGRIFRSGEVEMSASEACL